ncbi:MAG: 3,4-dihydroxy-2-butanone-4-phosphate synthase [Candidatus Diapherotrites archaeon]
MKKAKFDKIADAVNALRKGGIVIVVDDEARENEGDLVLAAEKATSEKINFILKNARGIFCVALGAEKAKQFGLEKLPQFQNRLGSPFAMPVDAAKGVSTGVSAADRCRTVKLLAGKKGSAKDLQRPGHIFPLIAAEGGVLQRAGHTEASVDLMKLAGLSEAVVLCEIMKDNGEMARLPDLLKFAKKFGLKLISVKDLIDFRLKKGSLIERVAETALPTEFGLFKAVAFRDISNGAPYLALVKGNVAGKKNVLVRVHSSCMTGDVFHSLRCDCHEQLTRSIEMINKKGLGVVLYIFSQEGRGIGLLNKLKAYALQDMGADTVEANELLGFDIDKRDYGIGAMILRELGLSSIHVISNNPKKFVALAGYGLDITKRIPLKVKPNKFNKKYLETKKKKLGHLL